MRIIGGKHRSRRFTVPGSIVARPTTDFSKEGLFNLLNNRIDFEELDVLDLFAGIGSISFEFISRGTRSVLALETSHRQVSFMREVAKLLQADNFSVIKLDVFRYLKTNNTKFDLIYADPPYDMDNFDKVPDTILSRDLLKEGGLLIVEHSAKSNFEKHPRFESHRKYGNVHFSIFV